MEAWDLNFKLPARTSPESATDLSQAIDRTFEFPDDAVVITWNAVEFSIPLAYGLSDILDDVLQMLDGLLPASGTGHRVAFSPNEPDGLDTDWALSWDDDVLAIEADWRSAPGTTEEIVATLGSIRTSKQHFVKSWLRLLASLCTATREVRLEHDDEVRAIYQLADAFGFGHL